MSFQRSSSNHRENFFTSNPEANYQRKPGAKPAPQALEQMIKAFNTALVSSKASKTKKVPDNLEELIRSPAFLALLDASLRLGKNQGLEPRESAELIIETMRQLDSLWSDFIFQEGIKKLKSVVQ